MTCSGKNEAVERTARSKIEESRERAPVVVLVGTLDTKGNEYAYLRERIREHGVDVLLIDAGILGEPLIEPDVTRQAVAMAAGADVQAVADARNRARAIETMSRGAAEIVLRLHADGRLAAIGALGGTGGTAIATHAMRQLPVGMPKLMVSTVASGDTSSYVGWTDITMMHSVADISRRVPTGSIFRQRPGLTFSRRGPRRRQRRICSRSVPR